MLDKESQRPEYPESLGKCKQRYHSRFEEILEKAEEGKLIIIVTHGYAV